MHITRALALGVMPILLATAHATSVIVSYDLYPSSAALDEFTIPNPQGGADLAIRPVLTLDSGSFEAVFTEGNLDGVVNSGPALIRNLTFNGQISIEITTTIDLGIITPTVTATLFGPLVGTQTSDAAGSILGDGTTFINSEPGIFDVAAGPLACESDFFNALCPILEAALGIEFPIEIPAVDNAPLPFAGLFTGLDQPGASTVGNTFDFSLPLGDQNSFGLEADVRWLETARAVVVPEPSSLLLGACAFLVLARRRRSPAGAASRRL